MSDDAGGRRVPTHGSVGPADPTADPATDPGMRLPAAEQSTGPVAVPGGPVTSGPAGAPPSDRAADKVRRSRTGGLWVALILSALVLLFLLVFIVQNDQSVQISFFAAEGVVPLGVALLLAAIAGILLVAIPGSLRILQLRRAARHAAHPKG